MDLMMGRFADVALAGMSEDELDEFERLIDVPDPELFGWIMGRTAPPAEYDKPMFRRMKAFNRSQ
jgi:antitoxin CptB